MPSLGDLFIPSLTALMVGEVALLVLFGIQGTIKRSCCIQDCYPQVYGMIDGRCFCVRPDGSAAPPTTSSSREEPTDAP